MVVTIRLRTLVNYVIVASAAVLATLVVMWAMRADAAPGDDDSTFVPVAPCRLMDTRPGSFRIGSIGTFGPEQTRTVTAHGANGDCVLPSDAVAVSLNVTAVGATSNTFITVWPSGERPNASSLNPEPGAKAFNAVTVPLDSGDFNLFNKAGVVDLIVDVNGYYTDSSLVELAERVAALEAKTAPMSRTTVDGEPVVRFTGVNVQVVSGSGSTNGPVNGTGNLIIGYHEVGPLGAAGRTGSHNLIVGPGHVFSSFGGLVAGKDNSLAAENATVTGGQFNRAAGNLSAVLGGSLNEANGSASAVSGGRDNRATGSASAVSGGEANNASGRLAVVSGGSLNDAENELSTVSGGRSNNANADFATVAGGDDVTCPLVSVAACGEFDIDVLDF